jgi:hypothetical protein
VAGVLVWRWPDTNRDRNLRILSRLAVLVGVGSALFHSFATGIAQLADVIPIGCFILAYLWIVLRHGFGWELRWVFLGFSGFGIASALTAMLIPPAAVNGSQTYFGTWLTLAALALIAGRYSVLARRSLIAATGTFAASLFFRSVDLQFCEIWPIGTHFLWHLLNGLLLYLCTRAYLHLKSERTRSGGRAAGLPRADGV